ncbi:major facilitator superfamily domain-containing protein [Chaetomium tenue]|uniref:Major facilitator superfamily domain-containing protein n=1 Tax=Chaetomium tenue TaxID=1854479 RepID=A0ACB7NZN5_9PEZI|nr:major facilitator superfamily domain-containing protein [Chaetomium globosum]
MASRASLGTSVMRSRPSTSEGRSNPSSLSSTPDLTGIGYEKQQHQQPHPQPPSLTISPATPIPSKSPPLQPNNNNNNNANTKPPDQPPSPSPSPEEPPFSIHTPLRKTLITLAASLAALFSTLSSYIYYPALTRIAADLHVSLMLVQLTITSYLVVAGVAPAFMGDMADRGGRRPVYVLMFVLMVGANVGIALQNRYEVLLVLRMVQSAGASGMYGAAYGVIADVAGIGERGSRTDFATSLGPVIGGGLTQGFGWRAIFWFLVIFTGSHFVLMLLFFPETQRKIVGNGSIKPKGLIYQPLFSLIWKKKGEKDGKVAALEQNESEEGTPRKRGFRFPNPLACLPVLANKGSLLVILITTINYAVKAALQTSLDAQCVELYGLNYIQAGLIYLPSGVGGAVGSRKARTDKLIHLAHRGYAGNAATDWDFNGFTLCGTLLTDLNMDRSATAQAASNLVRCLSAGGAVAILQPMVDNYPQVWMA